jgi:hypothetical protein
MGLLLLILGCGGVLGFYCLTLLGVGYLLFPNLSYFVFGLVYNRTKRKEKHLDHFIN